MAGFVKTPEAALGLGLGALLLAGCSAPTPAAQPAQPAASAPAANAPAQPKVNRVIVAAEPPGIESNEIRNLSTFYQWQLRPMYETLWAVDAKTGKNVPGLLSAWSLEPDGLSYRLKLRQGVQFHDGNGEFSVKDIAKTWEETSRTDSLGGQNAVARPSVKDWERVNDQEVLLRLKDPNPQVISAVGQVQIFSAADFEKRGPGTMQNKPNAGTGLYEYTTRTQGQFVRFQRSAQKHWSGLTPDFPEIEIRFIKEASTRLASLLTNEVHITDLPEDLKKEATGKGSYKTIAALAPGTRVLIQPHGVYYKDLNNLDLGMKFPDSPMASVAFRKALSKAINRDELNKAFFGGKGKLAVRSHYQPTWLGWNPDWEKRFPDEYGYDLTAAKKLLADAGFGPGKPASTTILLVPADGLSNSNDILEAVATMWRAAGIEVKLENIDSTTMTAKYRNADFDNHIRIRASAGDQWTGVTSYDSGIKPTRAGGIGITEADKVLQQILQTLDEKKLDDLMRQAGNLWYDGHVEVPLFWLSPEVVVNSTIVGGYDFPGNISGGWTHLENLKAAR